MRLRLVDWAGEDSRGGLVDVEAGVATAAEVERSVGISIEVEFTVSSVASGSGTALSDPNANRLEYRSITSLTGSRSSCEVIVAGDGAQVGSWMFSPFATRSVKSISSLRYSEKKQWEH